MRFPRLPAPPPSPPAQWKLLSNQPTTYANGTILPTRWRMQLKDLADHAEAGRGSCFVQSFWNALVLQRFGFPCTVRAGRMTAATTGHNWVEFPDGRILDGGNHHFARPVPTGTPNHFRVPTSGSPWFVHPCWSMFVLA